MKLTIAGCWGAYPPANEATSAYLLEKDGFRLLIDCGSGAISQIQNFVDLSELDALIVSHYHHDHKADIGCLQYNMFLQRIGGLRSSAFPIYGHCKEPEQFSALNYMNYTEGREITAHTSVVIGPWTVTFCETNHPAYCLAMRFDDGERTFVYTADTHWTDDMVRFCSDCDLLLSECSVYDHDVSVSSGHLTPELAGKLAQQSRARQLIITHLPHYGAHEEILERVTAIYSGPAQLAAKGSVIYFA
ncbi:MBL fold metallo-hydrolase [Paenibacillus sp. GXUN7292]|uniref:MBL fold metallo-hydrolase n=1 Tax=Paenibacillus sp. GXUN7292 TaxID=3422499 RepID=UPI003D7ECDAE